MSGSAANHLNMGRSFEDENRLRKAKGLPLLKKEEKKEEMKKSSTGRDGSFGFGGFFQGNFFQFSLYTASFHSKCLVEIVRRGEKGCFREENRRKKTNSTPSS